MKPTIFAPKGLLDKKPPHGAPCTRCGLCCMASLCPLATHVFGDRPGPCPALVKDETGFGCGLVAEPGQYREGDVEVLSEAALHLIGSGTGCDARVNGEPINHAFYRRLDEWDRRTLALTIFAKRVGVQMTQKIGPREQALRDMRAASMAAPKPSLAAIEKAVADVKARPPKPKKAKSGKK